MTDRTRWEKFIEYWNEEGFLSTLVRTLTFTISKVRRKFRLEYVYRSSIRLLIIKIRIRILQRLSSNSVTDADPFKIIRVSPSQIEKAAVNRKEASKNSCFYGFCYGLITRNSWDGPPITEWRKYTKLRKSIQDDGEYKKMLVESLNEDGYIEQKKLRSFRHHIPFHYREMEIGVHIDEDGEFYWAGWGRHRLFASKILELDEIAVQVHQRHCGWQELRDEIRAVDNIEELSERAEKNLDHPDLQDILPE